MRLLIVLLLLIGLSSAQLPSNLITKQLLDAKDFKGIEENVRKTIALVKSIKAELAGKK